jgi:phage terminase large subunit-like protein
MSNLSSVSGNSIPSFDLSLALKERAALAAELSRRLGRTKLYRYKPYAKQKEFHAAGAKYRERLLRAGNQLGKTYSGAAEMAFHLTGKYPDWWQGKRWDRPISAWVGGKDGITVRDSVVQLLLGVPTDRGTGLIPGDLIEDIATARGLADAVDSVTVKHVSGETSRLTFKTYLQGREQWQAATLDLVWFDEEPPADIYSEGLTRTNATQGVVYMTFTPLLGMSEVVRRFLTEQSDDRHDTNMTIEDALHIPAEQRAKIIASYPAHERDARTKGTPILGSGRIFPIAEEDITVAPFQMPVYWPKIGAMDFGWDHPFGAVELTFDPDGDVVYVTKAYRARQETPILHVAALKAWGSWIPWSWPHDGLQHDKGSGEQLAKQYESHGLNMLGNRATFSDGSNGVEAGVMEMLDRMQTGRLKVFANLAEWFEEFRLYHRKDGKIVKEADDLLSATRYGIMMLRHALLPPALRSENRKKAAARNPLGADPLENF